MNKPDYQAGMINLFILVVVALVLMGLMVKQWSIADYNGAAMYLGFLFIDLGIATYSFRVAALDGIGYKEVKD
ncbi:hypothetical protein [Heliophilum fasciatum]|uniref:Uncharacterized protein n=1 Tax=Heliophilum fasciatum TaxID=35700 RepID=A0A4R2RY42_9FIRM|nr:hypothetical protein [Heliophilum fasciatum]MCW2277040.1 hypothetical protein [Heliophilum fasciatum]TCP68434.1 hypothetical protein EDD73_10363 [Heliophilum fasciatum]